MNAIGLSILIAVILAVAFGSRRNALLAAMAGALFLTQHQAALVLGFNLFAYRFVEFAAFLRVVIRSEFSFSQLNRVDKALIWLYLYATAIFLIRSNTGQAYAIGTAVDAFLCYFAFRGLVGGAEEFKGFLRAFLLLLAPYALLVLFESFTGKNAFALLGGVAEPEWVREGRLRCMGSFRNPSLLGTLGASWFPIYLGLGCGRGDRRLALIGMGLCLVIVWASNSGAPLNCLVVGVAGWLLWPIRSQMQWFRRGAVIAIVALALVMKSPVWYLLAHVSDLTGGGGYHRAYLIDVAFKNLGKWWLAGMPISETAGWFPYLAVATGGADMTNQFLSFGIGAGVVAIFLFLRLLTIAFKNLGAARATVSEEPAGAKFILWGLGVMLAVHISNWLGITYFDQTYAIWFMQLATIVNLAEEAAARAAATEPEGSAAVPVEVVEPQLSHRAIATA